MKPVVFGGHLGQISKQNKCESGSILLILQWRRTMKKKRTLTRQYKVVPTL